MYETLFGNRINERCLLYIVNYGEGYAAQIAKTFGLSPASVKLQLEKLEADGILVFKQYGNAKVFRINPRLAIRNELTQLVEKMLADMPEDETQQYFRERGRPRRTGKKL